MNNWVVTQCRYRSHGVLGMAGKQVTVLTCKHYLQVQHGVRPVYGRLAERRKHKEALGEEESIKALEDAARLVGRGKKVEGGK